MSLYVFEDKARKKELKAKDAQKCKRLVLRYTPRLGACPFPFFLRHGAFT